MEKRYVLWEIDVRRQRKKWILARFAHLYERAISLYNQGFTLKDPRVAALNRILYYSYRECQRNGMGQEAKQIIKRGKQGKHEKVVW